MCTQGEKVNSFDLKIENLRCFKYIFTQYINAVNGSKLEIVLYTLFVLSCPTNLNGLFRPWCRVRVSLRVFSKLKWRGIDVRR